MTRKEKLLQNLKEDVLCKVGVSKINGVGLIAIKDIPKGTTVFNLSNYHPERDELVDVSEEEISSLDSEVVDLIKTYSAISHLGTYTIHENGLNNISLGYYLNHSDDPNITIKMVESTPFDLSSTMLIDTTPCQYLNFVAIKDIKKGEELTENYRHLSHDTEKLKEQFDFLK